MALKMSIADAIHGGVPMKCLIVMVAVLVAVSFLASSGAAQTPVFPASWEGEWEFTDEITLCGSSTVIETSVDTSGICALDAFTEDEGYVCTGTITDSDLNVDCGFTIDFSPTFDCSAEYSITIAGTRSGDNVTGTQTFSITYTGSECGSLGTDECEESTVTGVRLSTTPSGCLTPVEPATWGRIKALYRS